MHAFVALFVMTLGLLAACRSSRPSEASPAEAPPEECRAGVLLEGSSLRGSVRRVTLPAERPIHLVEGSFRTIGPKSRRRRASIERVALIGGLAWPRVETALGPRRRSPPFRTPVDRADTLRIEVDTAKVRSFEVTVSPVSDAPSAQEMLHRTVRLDADAASGPTHVFEVALRPLLRGSWKDDAGSTADRFRVDLSASVDPSGFRRIEVEPRSTRFDGPSEPRVDGPLGALRPGFHLRGGSTLLLEVPRARGRRSMVFHLHGPLGAVDVRVRLPEAAEWSGPYRASTRGWTRVELPIAPGASGDARLEVVGDGVALVGDPTLWPPPPAKRPPDVVLYMVDTLLASRLGALGSDVADVSPTMDRLVSEGLAYVRATSTSSWTKPAIPSLLTGVYPLTHRVGTRNYTDRLPDGVPMVQERFRDAGYRTLSASASPLGSTLSGLERGFGLAHPPARWSDEIGPLGHPDARQLQSAFWTFVDEEPRRPTFAYLHTLDVHEYERSMFADGADGEAPYDRAVRHQDTALAAFLEEYRTRERDVILVLLSDHGEGFGEYGVKVGHGYSVRQNQLHVPIVFHGPAWLPRGRVAEPASLVDVAPTLLDLFSLPSLPRPQGRSLLPGAKAPPRAVYAERTWFLWEPEAPRLLARVGADGRKTVTGYPQQVTWDLAQSPCEDTAHGRAPTPQETEALVRFEQRQRDAAAWWDAAYGVTRPGLIDADDVARLRALGYLE